LRTTLIDAMAHEFKTPLTLIKGVTTSVLAAPDHLSESVREQLTIANEEAEHLTELLDDAIEMVKLDTAHIEVHPELSELGTIVREVVASMQTELQERSLDVVIDPGIPLIPLDRRLVKMAVKQLLDNAVKYSPPDLGISIRVTDGDQTVSVEVTDHGPGIPAEEQARIFERFYRGREVRNQIPGSGLGLNIASSIVHAHHGDLTVTSRPGETTFRMTLPPNQTGGERN
jgi:two-component system sensor histidine kinase KdpD